MARSPSSATTAAPTGAGHLPRLTARLLRWRDQWLDRMLEKRGPQSPPLTLQYKGIFIFPTRFGFAFAMLLLVMGLGALNFNNNLGLFLTYLLAAVGHLSMHLAHRNISGLEVTRARGEPVFAGQVATLHLWLRAAGGRPRHAIALSWPGHRGADGRPLRDCSDIAADRHEALSLRVPTHVRGWLDPGRLRIDTTYPLGLLNCWSWVRPGQALLVWPRPLEDAPPLPMGGDGGHSRPRPGEGEIIQGVREYMPGDPMNRIAWRSSARHDRLHAKSMERPQRQDVVLRWQDADCGDHERTIRILAAWVVRAEQLGLPYRLQLNDTDLGPDLGDAHYRRCLDHLALLPRAGEARG